MHNNLLIIDISDKPD